MVCFAEGLRLGGAPGARRQCVDVGFDSQEQHTMSICPARRAWDNTPSPFPVRSRQPVHKERLHHTDG